jgi:hypothetical protein
MTTIKINISGIIKRRRGPQFLFKFCNNSQNLGELFEITKALRKKPTYPLKGY